MEKLRIILADCNYDYLESLELKFIEELGNDIELEVVTDREYFQKICSQPQNADILVISEELYFSNLQRHNIPNIFILVEEYGADKTRRVGVTNIYKYTSIKEIYNCILSVGNLRKRIEGQKTDTKVVLVYSPIGGSGKTTLSLGIASCLNDNYKKVLYINAERLNTFQQYLKDKNSIPMQYYADLMYPKSDLYVQLKSVIKTEGFDYIPPFQLALSSVGINFSIYKTIIESAKESGEYDVIMVDSDMVFDIEKANLIALADKVILTMKQDKKSVYAMNVLLENMNCSNTDKYLILCNDYDAKKSNELISDSVRKNFVVTDYINHFEEYEVTSIKELGMLSDIKKITFLIS